IRVKIGFLYGAVGTDGANFQVLFMEEEENMYTILSHRAAYDSQLNLIIKDLAFLAGKTGYFILRVDAGRSSGRDWAVWVEARIETITLPDLIVTDVWQKDNTIYYRIKNVGDAGIGSLGAPIKFCNMLFIDGIETSKDCFTGIIEPEQEVTSSFNYQWQTAPPKHIIKVCADWEQNVVEKDERNNCLEETWLPELTPTSISWTPTTPTVGERLSITVALKNVGDVASATCKGALLVSGSQVALVSIPRLSPGESRNMTLEWTPSVEGLHELTFYVDYYNDVEEGNESNNVIIGNLKVVGGNKGWLRVTTEPVKGSIYLNGTYVGLAPLEIELKAGTYNVSFGDVEGFIKPEPQTVKVHAGKVTNVTGTYIKITTPPPRLQKCFISGKIYAFPYDHNTLKIKIGEAERVCHYNPLTREWECSFVYKQGGRVWYADVSVHMYGMAGARTYGYITEVDCDGTYLVEPVYQPYGSECGWRGRWIPSNAVFVEVNGTSKEVNFTFEPFDQTPPNIKIEFSNDWPERDESVEIRILAEDNKGIKNIFIKIDKTLEGYTKLGVWRRLDFAQYFEEGVYKATAIEFFRESSVKKIVVDAYACDEGGNSRSAIQRSIVFGCQVEINLLGGGRRVTSDTPIFGRPDRDGDGISDCWENAAMEELNPWIELDEEEDLLGGNPNLDRLSGRDHITLDEMGEYDRVILFSRVTPYTSPAGERYILFYYIVTWSQDYGRFGIEAHGGDTEPVIMAWREVDDYTIDLECIYISAHGPCNKRDDIWEPYIPSCNSVPVCSKNIVTGEEEEFFKEETCSQPLEFYRNRLKLYASEDKHALYPSCQVCESVTVYAPNEERAWVTFLASIADMAIFGG
ncbi:MAG: PEGA domain-containing protein, partial [Candidatus Freyarchaeota archaeon]|nr:PEGA domain-containing protein [Candidatus Jordarchaeia archaeon]